MINIASSIFTSESLIVDQADVQATFNTESNEDGEPDLDNNVIVVKNWRQVGSAQTFEDTAQFLLPAESWKDNSTLEWVTSIKNKEGEIDSTEALFNDLMFERYNEKK